MGQELEARIRARLESVESQNLDTTGIISQLSDQRQTPKEETVIRKCQALIEDGETIWLGTFCC
jgi:hypothetical protein